MCYSLFVINSSFKDVLLFIYLHTFLYVFELFFSLTMCYYVFISIAMHVIGYL
jgi:hypothetical protein